MTAALDLGGVIGTPLCGAIAQVAGYPSMFATMAGACVVGLAVMAVDRARAGAIAPATPEG